MIDRCLGVVSAPPAAAGVSAAASHQKFVLRRAFGLKPHLQKNFKLSTDAFFVETVQPSLDWIRIRPADPHGGAL